MKRILLILGAVVLFVNTLVIPTVANADTPAAPVAVAALQAVSAG